MPLAVGFRLIRHLSTALICRAAANRISSCSRRPDLDGPHLSLFMNKNFESAIPMGNYIVSPATQETSTGLYRASIAVQRTQSKGAYCRIFNFDCEFVTREAARVYAITQGWLETGSANPQTC